MGTSIPIDILKVSPDPSQPQSQSQSQSADKTIWIRVPRQDAQAVITAVSSWIGGAGSDMADAEGGVAWRVCAKGNFLGALVRGDGRDLFVS
jgi:ribonuclease P/MRP protein subunit POP8